MMLRNEDRPGEGGGGRRYLKVRRLGSTSSGQTLGQWLATTFPNLYGGANGAPDLSPFSNAQVALYYKSRQRGEKARRREVSRPDLLAASQARPVRAATDNLAQCNTDRLI